jgi:hypothetical protein
VRFLVYTLPLAILVVLVPGAADACAVCFQAKSDASRIANIATTAAMTALPLALIGGFVWWIRRKFRNARAAAQPELAESSRRGVRAPATVR